jgi:hypothetical protein
MTQMQYQGCQREELCILDQGGGVHGSRVSPAPTSGSCDSEPLPAGSSGGDPPPFPFPAPRLAGAGPRRQKSLTPNDRPGEHDMDSHLDKRSPRIECLEHASGAKGATAANNRAQETTAHANNRWSPMHPCPEPLHTLMSAEPVRRQCWLHSTPHAESSGSHAGVPRSTVLASGPQAMCWKSREHSGHIIGLSADNDFHGRKISAFTSLVTVSGKSATGLWMPCLIPSTRRRRHSTMWRRPSRLIDEYHGKEQ